MNSRIIEATPESVEVHGAGILLSSTAVRQRAHRMLNLALGGCLQDWAVDLGRLPAAAEFVAQIVRQRYPRLDPPLHSRWRHFEVNGHNVWDEIASAGNWPDDVARSRAAVDLVLVSVLLDAGAGSDWRYRDTPTGLTLGRSEGLALASLRWFQSGGLSKDPQDPLRVDAAALQCVDARTLAAAFQSTEDNPLSGAVGRASLLNRLGDALRTRPDLFSVMDSPRPGGLIDAFGARCAGEPVPAAAILASLLESLGCIWLDRPVLDGVPLGDCWTHPALSGDTGADRFVPLHKLSQWLTYSLIEPFENAGLRVHGVDELTGLAEYRNGGLFVDMGVLVPREQTAWTAVHAVSSPFVVGWRALTVALLDRIAPLVSALLGLTSESFTLPQVLEGGTWAAGRSLAQRKRAGGGSPFLIASDGTVF